MKSASPVLGAAFLLLLFSASSPAAADTAMPVAAELSSRLGWTPVQSIDELGAPANIFPYRGAVENEDNVVFFYADHSYLFWFRDRVWQARVDSRWEGDIDGVAMGMTLEEVIHIWGRQPINPTDPAPTWTLPDRGYPVRIRLFFDDEGRLADVYVFRSDW